MNQVEFERRAAEVLDTLFDQIEDQLGDWLDVEMTGGILQIELPDGGTYVVNKHGPNREIWLSSPKSGAWHFGAEDGEGDGKIWRSTRGAEELTALLAGELAAASGRAVRLDL
ncbi:MAG TPA: iron donor protein CyaY [Dongiaceae bacterium]|jgi:frataxin|nr:iron donor protein CyaY [Dongiaceae bacterium]